MTDPVRAAELERAAAYPPEVRAVLDAAKAWRETRALPVKAAQFDWRYDALIAAVDALAAVTSLTHVSDANNLVTFDAGKPYVGMRFVWPVPYEVTNLGTTVQAVPFISAVLEPTYPTARLTVIQPIFAAHARPLPTETPSSTPRRSTSVQRGSGRRTPYTMARRLPWDAGRPYVGMRFVWVSDPAHITAIDDDGCIHWSEHDDDTESGWSDDPAIFAAHARPLPAEGDRR